MIVPSYYNKFKCIADKCKHNCCIGWEIDLDSDTLELYNSLTGELADRIRRNISGDTPHFVLTENERCPFLTDNGLCEIISEYGDDALCDICYLHPRFQNDYETFTEAGLGMCCEEAARIILSENAVFSLDLPRDITDEERGFFSLRSEVFDILQNREKSIPERFDILSSGFDLKSEFSLTDICEKYLSLERLDEKWTDILNSVKTITFNKSILKAEEYQLPLEQLAVYFVFRHFYRVLKGASSESVINFVLESCYLISAITSTGPDLCDTARMYSAEIEYSDTNMDELLPVIE